MFRFLYAFFFLWTGKSWKAPLSTSTRHYFWMGRTVTSRSAPWGRSGTCIKFTCVRLVQLFSSPNNRVLKTLVLLWLKCIFPLILQSGYFSSMFSGSWKESNMMVIELESPDQNIDTEGENSKNMFLTSPWYNKQVKDVVFICWHQTFISWPCFLLHLQPCKWFLGHSTGMTCWSNQVELLIFSLLLVCFSWWVCPVLKTTSLPSDSLKTYNYSIMQL